ncbi:DUF6221 family protein [Kitasatospora sp. NPDC002551]|uniref:DUF6221 family protein n=1 Tax=Kitasatospora sp. NPDC002551 TaxID=3154539 RepID=UPI00332139CC
MTDLLAFLHGQLREDERIARAAEPVVDVMYGWCDLVTDEVEVERTHHQQHLPNRVLAEIAAKRRIIAECCHMIRRGQPEKAGAEWILQVLAMPYADRPDYRPEWAPGA